MNSNKIKQIHRKTARLLVDWLCTMVSDEEAKIVNTKNIREFMPKEIYAPIGSGFRCVPMSPRWIKKELKRMIKRDSKLDINSVTLNDLEKIADQQRILNGST